MVATAAPIMPCIASRRVKMPSFAMRMFPLFPNRVLSRPPAKIVSFGRAPNSEATADSPEYPTTPELYSSDRLLYALTIYWSQGQECRLYGCFDCKKRDRINTKHPGPSLHFVGESVKRQSAMVQIDANFG